MDITWFPNSWIRVRTGGKIMYFDPAYIATYFSKYADKTDFSKWPDPIDGLPNGLEKGDFIFITHSHKDHCKKVTVDRLRTEKTQIYAPISCKKELTGIFQAVKPNDLLVLGKDMSLKVIDAYNTENGTSTTKQHKKGVGVGYLLNLNGFTIYHAGDTDFIPEMSELIKINIALIPMGGKFTMNIEEAILATKSINPKIVVPIHHLASEPQQFADALKNHESIKCIVPKIGQPIEI